MIFGERFVLWIGSPCMVVRLIPRPLQRSIREVLTGPDFTAGDVTPLSEWLTGKLPAGATVDVVYQHHLLQIFSFPLLGPGELDAALATRLKRELLVPAATLLTHVTRVDGGGRTQAVFAAVSAAEHLVVTREIQSLEYVLGRVGFAGALAVKRLIGEAPPGGFAVLPNLALGQQLLVGASPDGQLAAASYPTGQGVTAESARLYLPQLPAHAAPVALTGGALGGVALPGPLAPVILTFLTEPAWRVPSAADRDFPYYFSAAAWTFIALFLMVLGYTAYLVDEIRDRQATRGTVDQLAVQLAALDAEQKSLERRVRDYDYLQKNGELLGSELYASGAWLHFVGQLRDAHAPGLLFQSIVVNEDTMTFSGESASMAPILALHSRLIAALDDQIVRFSTITRDGQGQHAYVIRIARPTAQPPAVKGS